MDSYSDPASPTEPVPPAYEAASFDQKVSQAVDDSLSIPQTQPQDGEWEEWDDAKFEAALSTLAIQNQALAGSAPSPTANFHASDKSASAPTSSDSKSSPVKASQRPLPLPPQPQISKPQTKERPSWYRDAQLPFDQPSFPGPSAAYAPTVLSTISSSPSFLATPAVGRQLYADDVPDDDEPPPAFDASPPSTTGPAMEITLRAQQPWQPLDTLSSSPPSSPLLSPAERGEHVHPHIMQYSPPQPLPNAPPRLRIASRPAPQPAVTLPSRFPKLARPQVHFNAALAYSTSPDIATPENPAEHYPVDPASFYSSAVSAHMVARKSPAARATFPAPAPVLSYTAPAPGNFTPQSHPSANLPQVWSQGQVSQPSTHAGVPLGGAPFDPGPNVHNSDAATRADSWASKTFPRY